LVNKLTNLFYVSCFLYNRFTCLDEEDWLKLWNDRYLTSVDFCTLFGRTFWMGQTMALSFEDGSWEYDAEIALTGQQKSFEQCVHFSVVQHVECKDVCAFKIYKNSRIA
jgi:hypothetical protein